MQNNLHPSVIKFKEFVRNNPALIKEVREGRATWQELYEDWYLLGENDTRWGKQEGEKSAETKKIDSVKKEDWISTIIGVVQKMDPDQIQHYINNLSQAISAVQGVLSQFQGTQSKPVKKQIEHRHPFSFRKD